MQISALPFYAHEKQSTFSEFSEKGASKALVFQLKSLPCYCVVCIALEWVD